MQKDAINNHIDEFIGCLVGLRSLNKQIRTIAKTVTDCLKRGNKILIAGNGGSAADAEHFAAEIVGKLNFHRKSLPAIALTSPSTTLTAIGNDYGYKNVFSRQIEGYGQEGDVFIGITTSGNSQNIINAVDQCGESKITSIVLTSEILNDALIIQFSDIFLEVPSKNTMRIQEMHGLIIHILCDFVEQELFSENSEVEGSK